MQTYIRRSHRSNGKTAGPDGFVIVLQSILGSFYFRTCRLPEYLYSANISLILKKEKDETDPASYLPIALLGCDLKIFTKILVNRLNKCIVTIIHHNQACLIPGRLSFFNVRRLMNVMYSSYDKDSNISILALDAQKGFDQVEWRCILTVIN